MALKKNRVPAKIHIIIEIIKMRSFIFLLPVYMFGDMIVGKIYWSYRHEYTFEGQKLTIFVDNRP